MKQSFDPEHFFKTLLQKNVTVTRKQQNQTIWHWLLLVLFGLLAIGNVTQQVVLIALFTVIVALVKGPLMIIWGVIYSALIAFFPPFALILSLLFFFINLGAVVKSWRISLTSAYFYLLPIAISLLKHYWQPSHSLAIAALVVLSILGLHVLLEWLYTHDSLSRMLAWRIISAPYALILLLIPNRWLPKKRSYKIKRK